MNFLRKNVGILITTLCYVAGLVWALSQAQARNEGTAERVREIELRGTPFARETRLLVDGQKEDIVEIKDTLKELQKQVAETAGDVKAVRAAVENRRLAAFQAAPPLFATNNAAVALKFQ
jgi:hypothetical protein